MYRMEEDQEFAMNPPENRKRASSPTQNNLTPPITPQRSGRKSTPPSTGGSRRGHSTIYSDRFIPSRTTTNLEEAFDLLGNKYNQKVGNLKAEGNISSSGITNGVNPSSSSTSSATAESQLLMNNLLRSELLGQPAIDFSSELGLTEAGSLKSPTRRESGSSSNLFKYRLSQGSTTSVETTSTLGGAVGSLGMILDDDDDRRSSVISLGMDLDDRSSGGGGVGGGFGITGSPASSSRSSYLSPGGKKTTRKIPKTPYKILDAPSLQDDYYLNLVDWSHHNVLAVALCSSVYLWSACTSKVTKLCDFGSSDMVTSISWALSGHQIAVGMNSGKIQIWDSVTSKMLRELHSHDSRVGALAWNSSMLASGSRDRSIYLQDIRIKNTNRSSFGGNSSVNSSIHGGTPGRGTIGGIGGIHHDAALHSFPFTSSSTSPPQPESLPASSRPLIPTMAEGMILPHTITTASNSDDTYAFTDPLSNITTNLTAPPITTHTTTAITINTTQGTMNSFASMQGYLSPPRSRSSGLLSSFTPEAHLFTNNNQPPPNLNGSVVRDLHAHKQEVCGLRWSFDEKMLASGGNDNKLFVWEPSQTNNDPLHRFEDHTAAVKAVAWSPHQQGLLASGGGTADRHIRFWSATTGTALHKVDTGSQVCNLMWSKTVNELVSTHGYSLNQVIVWKYPVMQKLATLSGHTLRVLYLAMSPDGQTIVTGAGDETLRFWNVFPAPRNRSGFPAGKSLLIPSGSDVR